jgi:hypothetical protein
MPFGIICDQYIHFSRFGMLKQENLATLLQVFIFKSEQMLPVKSFELVRFFVSR